MTDGPSQEAFIYCRTASANDKDASPQLAEQEAFCREVAAARGYRIVHVFRDRASGLGTIRPGLEAMLDALRQRGASSTVVLIEHASRLARDPAAVHMLTGQIAGAGGTLDRSADC
jgi:DNA invertase Pin-like site-specific DNA recombinase